MKRNEDWRLKLEVSLKKNTKRIGEILATKLEILNVNFSDKFETSQTLFKNIEKQFNQVNNDYQVKLAKTNVDADKTIEKQVSQMNSEYQLDLTKVKTETDKTLTKFTDETVLHFANEHQLYISHVTASTTNIINENGKTFNNTYGKDFLRLIALINNQRTNSQKYLKEINIINEKLKAFNIFYS